MIEHISFKSVFKFTLPSIAAMVFMGFYTMVDGLFVANFLGTNALSALNIAFPAMTVFFAIGTMLGTGGNAVCATLLGETKHQDAKEKFTLFSISGFAVGIVTATITILYLNEILIFLGTNEETFSLAYDYLYIITLFSPFAILQIILESAMIASGRPQLSLITILAGGFTNIILDYVFIKLGFGMDGISLATGLGFFVPCLIGMVFFSINKSTKSLHFTKFKFDLSAILKASGNGSSEMVVMLATSVSTYLFNITMLDLAGNNGIAAITVILYTQMFINTLFVGYTIGIAPVISFNYGENNSLKLRRLFELNMRFIIVSSIIMFFLAIIFGNNIVSAFAKQGTTTYTLATGGFSLFAWSFLFSGMNIFASGMFTAYSNGKISAFLSFLRTLFFITLALLTLPKIIGINGVWLAVPLAEFLSMFFVIYFIIRSKKEYMYAKTQ